MPSFNYLPLALCLAATLLAINGNAHAADACTAEQAEVTALKARVLELQDQLDAARASIPARPGGLPAAAAAAATAEGPSVISPATPAKPNQVTRKVVVVEEEAYSRTGCSLGLFKGTPPGRWKERNNWDDLSKGMSAQEAERLLGVEHYNVGTGSRVIWQYGKCGVVVHGQVLLVNGLVDDWRTPQF